ncbi:MAG TPA: hypothetical protein VFF88_00575 [Methylocella sp.]|nr:hypothetical protein [Methylocella sp.]
MPDSAAGPRGGMTGRNILCDRLQNKKQEVHFNLFVTSFNYEAQESSSLAIRPERLTGKDLESEWSKFDSLMTSRVSSGNYAGLFVTVISIKPVLRCVPIDKDGIRAPN